MYGRDVVTSNEMLGLSLFRVGTGLRLEEMRNVNKGGMKSSVAPESRRKLRPHQEMDDGHRRRNKTWMRFVKSFVLCMVET